jgi:hypothetical protein
MSNKLPCGCITLSDHLLEIGVDLKKKVGSMEGAEHAWHCVNAAVSAIRKGDDLQALGVLYALLYVLADATGRDKPKAPQCDAA